MQHRIGWSDESFAGSTMVLSVVQIGAGDVDEARAALCDLRIGGSGVLHFSQERPDRRPMLAKAVGDLGLDLTVVIRRSRDSNARARAICLTTIAWALRDELDQLVIESRGAKPDRLDADLFAKLRRTGCRMPVRFVGKHADPLLWSADILASATFQAVANSADEYLELLGSVRRIDC
jgi:hypothetical protein